MASLPSNFFIGDEMRMVYEAIKQKLQEASVDFVDHEHEPIRTVQDALEKWPYGTDNLVKTVAFRLRDDRVVLAATLASARIDYKRLASVLGIGRRDIASLSPAEVHERLEVEPGGVCPIPVNDEVQVIVDEPVGELQQVFCGFGRVDHTLQISASELIRVGGGIVAEISRV
ncbi:MAG: hypothetical protein ETSY2_29890 [Candidatus Entotheonella gemina]|uniref:YbaK/aminoacyl-tRNA synthetase-associated domain-containing protein n=1 Tax=Candidatus Entotheonella gemina TaxID=1429439 RepID=W4M2Q8_9BACT|nr:MAG: hypothetical protein ETSY2_29890 [Candidatus Entotheonella gemina]